MTNLISNFNFSNGLVFNSSLQVLVVPLNSFMIILNQLFENYSKVEIIELFEKSTLENAKLIVDHFSKNEKNKVIVLKNILNSFSSYGFGEYKLIKSIKAKIVVSDTNNNLTNRYISMFNKKPLLHLGFYFNCFFKNVLQNLYSKKIISNIETLDSNKIYYFEMLDEKYFYNTNKTYDLSLLCDNNSKVNSLILNKKIISNDGFLSLNGRFCFMVPIYLYLNFLNFFFKNHYLFCLDLLSCFGASFIKFLNANGVRDSNKKFELICESWNLGGLGYIEKRDGNYFKIKTNIFDKYLIFYSKDFIDKFKNYTYISLLSAYDFSFDIKSKINFINDSTIEFVFVKIKNKKDSKKELSELLKLVSFKNFVVKV